jgi:hypothetical protein
MKNLALRGPLLGCATLLALAASVPVGAQGQQQTLVIQGGTLIDGNGGNPVANATVIIQGNRITQVGRGLRVPAGAQVIDASGKYVLPGLIDAKGNWNWQYGEPYLTYGVTSVVVSGGRNNQGLADRDAINRGIFRGPRLFQTIVTINGPGPMRSNPDRYRPGDGNRVVRNGEEAVAHVRTMVDAGADIITFQNGDGPPDVFAPAVAEAQRLGKGIDFRAMGPQSRAREVCAMGKGIVYVHTGNVGTQIAKDPAKWAEYIGLPPDAYADMDEAKVGPMIRELVACNAYLEPDLMAADRGFHKNWARVQQESRDFLKDPALAGYYPQYSIRGVWENQKSPETYLTPQQRETRALGFKNHAAFLKRFVDAGGHVVAASDTPQTAPGLGVHQEITAFVEDVGLTPMQAIQAGTSWVADGFKFADLGRVQAGKLADVIVVNANPLQDIKNLREVDTVIKDGRLVERKYEANYKGWMFQNSRDEDYDVSLGGGDWAAALKTATWRPQAQNGGFGGAGGFESELAPTPGIEAFAPHTVLRGSPDTVVKITGFNFVKGSQVTVDGTVVPAKVTSRTEIEATIPAAVLANAGRHHIMVRNPKPLATPIWGETSNPAHLLVPYEFTKVLPQPRW